MPLAVEQVRRMRGGAQAHLMRCAGASPSTPVGSGLGSVSSPGGRSVRESGDYYVVKFQNNPQGARILANELLATRLAARLGLPTPPVAVIEVREELIAHTDDLVMQLGRGRARCQPGLQFGSRYPGSPAENVVYDFLPDEQLREVENLGDFCGMLVFDKWTCNTNGRQAIFFRAAGEARYRAQMIDNGFCFNAGEWNFPDAPLRGIYARHGVYEGVRGMEAFEPWLARLEQRIDGAALEAAASEIPPAWYDDKAEALEKMLEHLLRRRTLARELIISAKKSSLQPFPDWK
jgi:HipA-like protein